MAPRLDVVGSIVDPPIQFPSLLGRPMLEHRLYSQQLRGPLSDVGLCSTLARSVPLWPGLVSSPTPIVLNRDRLVGHVRFVQPGAPERSRCIFSDARLHAFLFLILEGLGVQHGMVSALPVLPANDPWGNVSCVIRSPARGC